MPRDSTDFIVVHTALTFPDQEVTAKIIRGWHQRKGWMDIGYHSVINRDGLVEWGRNLPDGGAHVRGFNDRSVGIVLAGGLDHLPDDLTGVNEDKIHRAKDGKPIGILRENYTVAQWEALLYNVTFFKRLYPDAIVCGHRDLAPGRWCPGFSVAEWWHTNAGLEDLLRTEPHDG